MPATTTTQAVTYTGSNPLIESLWWGAAWASSEPGPIVIEYYLQSGADPNNVNDIPNGRTWRPFEEAAMEQALGTWAAVANIEFQEAATPGDANLWHWLGTDADFDGALGWHEIPIANARQPLYGAFSVDGFGWTRDGLEQGGYGFVTAIHEVGHGLGLAHPHDLGGDSIRMPGVTQPFDDYGDFDLNQGIWTTMGYNDGWETQYPFHFDPDYGWQGTPMALDIAAIQEIYGANMNTATGNDLYELPDSNGSGTFWFSIWDAGGNDTITAASSAEDFQIDLREAPLTGANAAGYVSYAPGIVGGATIANGVTIENAFGGKGDDDIRGNDADNMLDGNGGADTIVGAEGDDTLRGDGANDNLSGGADDDVVTGGTGQDTLSGGSGDDVMRGNGGADTLTGGGGDDTMIGGTGSDSMSGQNGDDLINGGGGRDTMDGGAGADTMDGGGGNDLILGGDANDTLTGGAGSDVFVFAAGNGADRVTDFQNNTDALHFEAALFNGSPDVAAVIANNAQNIGGYAVFTFDNGGTLTVEGIGRAALEDDILII